jgi:ADP-ribose pyrophosphatase
LNKKINYIKKKTLYSGFFQLHQLTFKHKKHDGTWSIPLTREIFGGAQVATVLPYDPEAKKIILLEQIRVGIIESNHDPVIKEIVAGMIDKGETPEKAAIRECKEEIGCEIKKLTKIHSYYPVPGSSQSYYHFFLAEVQSFENSKILGKKDENEDILVRCYSLEEVEEMLNCGKIINGLTLVALQWFFLNYKKLI